MIETIPTPLEPSETTTFICSKCGGTHNSHKLIEFDGKAICQYCFDAYTTLCGHCGERIWRDYAYSDDSTDLCQRCFDTYYYRCTDCEQFVSESNVWYHCDDPYCRGYYDELDDNDDYSGNTIHDYNYKPAPLFYGEGIHFGVELEVDEAGESRQNAEIISTIGNSENEHIYIKHDGSLYRGFEIVSHPMTLNYHQNDMNWREIMAKLVELGYLSHKANTCGLHIHVERAKLGGTIEHQDEVISSILYFVEKHWYELLRFSRRTPNQIQQWASRYGYNENPKKILNCAKSGNWGRYVCVNLQNYNTIEFRMFRGTLKYSTFIATLQLVDEICHAAMTLPEEELKALTWADFVSKIDKSEKAELINYLKFKSLYVNDPIDEQEEI